MVSTYLYQLFLSLADEGIVSPVSSATDAVIFSNAIRYLNCHLHTQPSVIEIARHCNVSESSLKRTFDKYAGISVHKYLVKLKIKVAMELLQDGESVFTVSEKLGFNSQSYFSKAFKRETGKSPSELKQKVMATAILWRTYGEYRKQALKTAIREDRVGRAAKVKEEIAFSLENVSWAGTVTDGLADGSIPLRVTHNDTKINNILFDRESGKSICVIDPDKVWFAVATYEAFQKAF